MWVTFRLNIRTNKSIQLYFGITLLVCRSESRVLAMYGEVLTTTSVRRLRKSRRIIEARHELRIITCPTSAPNSSDAWQICVRFQLRTRESGVCLECLCNWEMADMAATKTDSFH